jgi:hypothetical protein
MSLQKIRLLFRTAALFNWAAVAFFLPVLGLANRLGRGAPSDTAFEHLGIGAIALFGLGYWMVASAPEQNRGIVQLGLLGKIVAIVLVVGHYLAGNVSLPLALVVSGDVIFAVLFARYLAKTGAARGVSWFVRRRSSCRRHGGDRSAHHPSRSPGSGRRGGRAACPGPARE